jgi:O-antigen/teichoic acid export membrane protein
MAVIVLPVAAMLVFFASDILRLWIGNVETTRHAAPIVSLLVVGSALNSIMVLPYSLQLAHGWTSLGVRINIFLICFMVPTILFLSTHYGPLGAAAAWVALNGLYILIGAPLTYRRLLKGEGWRWFVEDVSLPLTGVIVIAGVGRWLIASPLPPLTAIVCLMSVSISTLLTAIVTASHVRAWAWNYLSRMRLIRV